MRKSIKKTFEHVDEGIREIVEVLNKHGFDTWESCEGGEGHCCDKPMIRFRGNEFDLIRAFRLCENYGFDLLQANRVYGMTEIATGDISESECPNGKLVWDAPFNELIFRTLPNHNIKN